MTKILYIPNGEYIRFFNGSFTTTFSKLENLLENELANHEFETILKYLNDQEDVCEEWYEENNIEHLHIFLASEIEVIYD